MADQRTADTATAPPREPLEPLEYEGGKHWYDLPDDDAEDLA